MIPLSVVFSICFICCFTKPCASQDLIQSELFPVSQSAKQEALTHLIQLNQQLTLSHFSVTERENNLRINQYAYAIIKALSDTIEDHATYFPIFLHLAYKLANSFQQNDRPADGEIVLNLALQAIERKFPKISDGTPPEVCETLRRLNPQLPALYAALLHYSGKTWFYKKFFLSIDEDASLDTARNLIRRSLELRTIIDSDTGCQDLPDSGNERHCCSHTLLFTRTLGYCYLEKGDFIAAQICYEHLFSKADPFEKMMAALKLVNIYSQLGKQEWDSTASQERYRQAYEKAIYVENYLKTHHFDFSGLPLACLALAEFYLDKSTLFYCPEKAEEIFGYVAKNNHRFPQMRMTKMQKKLADLYQQRSKELSQTSEQAEKKLKEAYFAGETSRLLNPDSKKRVEGISTLAAFYCRNKLFLQATLLLGNALANSEKLDTETCEKLWHQLYMTEREFTAVSAGREIAFPSYKGAMLRYKQALHDARQRFKQALTIDSCWKAHLELAHDLEAMFQGMFKEILALLPSESAGSEPFAIVAIGSLAHGTPSPYSDLEFVLVHNVSVSPEELESFSRLSTLFLLRLFALGETPFQRYWEVPPAMDMTGLEANLGIRPDRGGTISHSFGSAFKMVGTPSQLISACSSHSALFLEFSNGRLLFGSPELVRELHEKGCEKILNRPGQNKELFWYDYFNHTVPLIKVNVKGERCFSPKHCFTRGITLMLRHLALNQGIIESNPHTILQQLSVNGTLTQASMEHIDLLLRRLYTMQSLHYFECGSQTAEIALQAENFQLFLEIVEQFQKAINVILEAMQMPPHLNVKNMRSLTLCRGGYLNDFAMEDWESRGNIALMQADSRLAYAYYMKGLEENPSNTCLHFKLAEAALQDNDFDKFRDHMVQLDKELAEKSSDKMRNDVITLKVNYLKMVAARKEGNWEEVKSIRAYLEKNDAARTPILKKASLTHAFIELEIGRLERHLGHPELAIQHMERAKDLIAYKYGPLHIALLSIYEELIQSIDKDDFPKRDYYHRMIKQIGKLFPDISWFGVMDCHSLN